MENVSSYLYELRSKVLHLELNSKNTSSKSLNYPLASLIEIPIDFRAVSTLL